MVRSGVRAQVGTWGGSGAGGVFEGGEAGVGVGGVATAHVGRGAQAGTEGGTLGPAEDRAAQVGQELHAGDARGLAIWSLETYENLP